MAISAAAVTGKPARTRDAPERRCIATREVHPRDALIRFAISPDGEIVPDLEERLPGRGLWLTARGDIVRRACRDDLFSRAARRKVTTPDDLLERLVRLLGARCLDQVALARRSGAAVAGFEKVRAALAANAVAVRIEASDGSPDGREKLSRRDGGGAAGTIPVVGLWSAAELGVPFGREAVVHAALGPGGLARRFMRDATRLEGLLDDLPGAARPEFQES